MAARQTRRRFLATLALAGRPGLFDVSRARASEAPLESTTLRLVKQNGICTAPALVADELLRAEGFTDLVPVPLPSSAEVSQTVGSGRADFGLHFSAAIVAALDAGLPLTVLAGVHLGCFELFGHDNVRSITDLKGKSVGVPALGSSPHVFLSAMAANVGLDPASDISWVSSPSPRPIDLFADGKIDAFLAFPPEPQDLRARGIGHVLVNTALGRPWSQYFCCMHGGNREFVQKYPVATKRVLRAVLKAADMCASDPERAARRLVDGSFTPRYDYALQTLRDNAYDKWREFDPEDAIRFYALRLREAGFIKSSPQKIIADSTDWRFLDELKREMKV